MGEDDDYTKDGTVDHQGNPANKKITGTWRACPFILGTFVIHIPNILGNGIWLWDKDAYIFEL